MRLAGIEAARRSRHGAWQQTLDVLVRAEPRTRGLDRTDEIDELVPPAAVARFTFSTDARSSADGSRSPGPASSIRDRAADLGRNRVHRQIEKAFRALG